MASDPAWPGPARHWNSMNWAFVHEFWKILNKLGFESRSDLEKNSSPLNRREFKVFRGLGLDWPGLAGYWNSMNWANVRKI